jgi:hypothetical protein
MAEQTWGFDFEKVPEAGFDELPPGHYTMEIVKTTFKTNKNGEEYLSVEYNVADAQESDLIGRTHFHYVSLDPERLQYTKKDFRKMGVPEKSLTNEGGPSDMIGTVFECDLVRNDKGYTNMRYITSKVNPANAASPEKSDAKPKPQRAAATGSSRR